MAGSTQLEIGLLGFEVISHHPYSPDLAPFDCHFPGYQVTVERTKVRKSEEAAGGDKCCNQTL